MNRLESGIITKAQNKIVQVEKIYEAKVSDYIKAKINKSGIIFFDMTDLIGIGYDKGNLGRNIQTTQP